jgi:hypothetical protein
MYYVKEKQSQELVSIAHDASLLQSGDFSSIVQRRKVSALFIPRHITEQAAAAAANESHREPQGASELSRPTQ